MTRRKYYIIRKRFRNEYDLFFVATEPDLNALAELLKRGKEPERITRARALQLVRRDNTVIYKCTSMFVYDPHRCFGNQVVYMDKRGNMHGYRTL